VIMFFSSGIVAQITITDGGDTKGAVVVFNIDADCEGFVHCDCVFLYPSESGLHIYCNSTCTLVLLAHLGPSFFSDIDRKTSFYETRLRRTFKFFTSVIVSDKGKSHCINISKGVGQLREMYGSSENNVDSEQDFC